MGPQSGRGSLWEAGVLPGRPESELPVRRLGPSTPSPGAGWAEAAGAAQPEAATEREGVGAHTCQSSPELLSNFVS